MFFNVILALFCNVTMLNIAIATEHATEGAVDSGYRFNNQHVFAQGAG